MVPIEHTKLIFITGGVVSSLGKGVTAAALAALLEARGLKVTLIKLDPYLNVDPGTMSPLQHGEVFVTEDGGETDLDLGHYERFVTTRMGRMNNITSGKVYQSVIAKERKGGYLGATVQVIPHITDEIQLQISEAIDPSIDVALVEVGGTVGDIESLPFLEAIRQLGQSVGRLRSLFIHVTLLPCIQATGEVKTKPTQHSVKALRSVGIYPDILVCRSRDPLVPDDRKKISLFTHVDESCIFSAEEVDHIHSIPDRYHQQGLDRLVLERLTLPLGKPQLGRWHDMVLAIHRASHPVTIAMVGKYVAMHDAYRSLNQALFHAAVFSGARLNLRWVDADALLEQDPDTLFHGVDGILVPGGFGHRGVEGKIKAVTYARTKKIPFLGICLGMQVAVIEYARYLLGLDGANSREFDPKTPYPVVDLATTWQSQDNQVADALHSSLGGTMRLGSQLIDVTPNSLLFELYKKKTITERHRHRYEVNHRYVGQLKKAGMVISGYAKDQKLVESIELPDHPWFVACQFHPEFNAQPCASHPLFDGFLGCCLQGSPFPR